MEILALITTVWASISAGQIPPVEVLKLLVSKGLGLAVIGGACITKIPQIQVILKNRSAEGLSAISLELEVVGLVIHSAYGYLKELPITTYGEAIALLVQTYIILSLVYYHGGASMERIAVSSGVFLGLIAGALSGQVPERQLEAAFGFNTIIFIVARVPQIVSNFWKGSTGQLSIVTASINTIGCVVRIFTTISENAGTAMLRQYIISLVLNATIVLQILAYSSKKKGLSAAGRKAAKAAAASKKKE